MKRLLSSLVAMFLLAGCQSHNSSSNYSSLDSSSSHSLISSSISSSSSFFDSSAKEPDGKLEIVETNVSSLEAYYAQMLDDKMLMIHDRGYVLINYQDGLVIGNKYLIEFTKEVKILENTTIYVTIPNDYKFTLLEDNYNESYINIYFTYVEIVYDGMPIYGEDRSYFIDYTIKSYKNIFLNFDVPFGSKVEDLFDDIVNSTFLNNEDLIYIHDNYYYDEDVSLDSNRLLNDFETFYASKGIIMIYE